MNRRNFIKNSSIAAGATSMSFKSTTPKSDKPKFKMGYQLYSIRDAMAKDPMATLVALKKMGYEDFELYGYEDQSDKFYGFKSKEFKNRIDDLGVTITSGHYGFSPYLLKSDDELKGFVDRCIIGAKNIGSDYITWPWLNPAMRNMYSYKLMAQKLNVIGEQVNKAGLKFAYHNHGFEFIRHAGETGYEIIMNETDADKVKLQIDMYWVIHSADITPKALVEKQPGRFVMWHIKDMDAVTRDYTEVGNGSINYLNLLPDPALSGLEYYYLEQGGNYATNSTVSAADSAKYCKDNLVKYL